jgi:hypothetical protein
MIPIEDAVYHKCRTRGSHTLFVQIEKHLDPPYSTLYRECSDCHIRLYDTTGFVETFEILPNSTQLPARH